MSIRVTHPGSLRGRQSPSSVTNSPSSSGRHDSRKLSFKPIRGNPARFDIVSQSFRQVLEPLYGPQKSALDKVAAGHDRRCRLAVEPDGQPCGVLVYKTGISNEMAKYGIKDSIEIKTLYLINAAVNSGKGYAGEMLSYIVKKASDMRAASVHVTVSEKVPQSLTFFTKKGFRLVKTFTGLYQTGVKEYLLHLPLVADPASAAAGTPAAEPPAVDVATATGQQLQQPEQQLSYAASSRLSKSDYERLLPPSKCASTPLAVSDKSTANATAAITAITEGSKKRQFEELDDLYDRIGPTKTGNGQSSKAPHYAVMSDSKQGTKTQLESSSRLFPGPPQLHKGDGRSVPVAGLSMSSSQYPPPPGTAHHNNTGPIQRYDYHRGRGRYNTTTSSGSTTPGWSRRPNNQPPRGLQRPLSVTLKPQYINMIRSGSKTVEGRINSGMFARVKPGDLIRFWARQDEVHVVVESIYQYGSWRAMLEGEGVQTCLPNIRTLEEGVRLYNNLPGYREKAERFGVLALRIRVV